jgi:signal peptidase
MEPAFFRGDLLLLTNYREEPIRAGDIVVFRIEGRDIPIVHRVLKVHEKYVWHFNSSKKKKISSNDRDDGYVKFLTKGDNNQVDDRGLYAPGQLWLEKKDVIGRARGYTYRFSSNT